MVIFVILKVFIRGEEVLIVVVFEEGKFFIEGREEIYKKL